MKKYLLLVVAAMLAACANTNGNKTDNDANKVNLTPTTTLENVEKPHEIDWEKPQYSIDDHGDTITR